MQTAAYNKAMDLQRAGRCQPKSGGLASGDALRPDMSVASGATLRPQDGAALRLAWEPSGSEGLTEPAVPALSDLFANLSAPADTLPEATPQKSVQGIVTNRRLPGPVEPKTPQGTDITRGWKRLGGETEEKEPPKKDFWAGKEPPKKQRKASHVRGL